MNNPHGGNNMNHFRKTLAIFMVVIMLSAFTALFSTSFAAASYNVTFKDLPYDIITDASKPARTDWPALNQGYTLGVEYRFAFATPVDDDNDPSTADKIMFVVEDGEVTKSVQSGKALEFKIAVKEYVAPSSVQVLAFPSTTTASDLYNHTTGEPKSDYIIQSSNAVRDKLVSDANIPRVYDSATGEYTELEGYTLAPGDLGIYAVLPTKNLTICVSEFHMYNHGFMLTLDDGADYTLAKYTYKPDGYFQYVYDDGNGNPVFNEEYISSYKFYGVAGVDYIRSDIEDPSSYYKITKDTSYKTRMIYYGEPVYIGIEIPKTNAKKTYHHDTYTLSYSDTAGLFGMLPSQDTKVLKGEPVYNETGTVVIDNGYSDAFVFTYETDHSYVDIYKFDKLAGSPTFTAEGVSELDLSDITGLFTGDTSLSDLTGKGMGNIIGFFKKLFNLIKKILSGLGVSLGG